MSYHVIGIFPYIDTRDNIYWKQNILNRHSKDMIKIYSMVCFFIICGCLLIKSHDLNEA